MKRLLEPGIKAEDFVSPGHVFPLIANPSGVLGRQGQTEGSYDLARIAGFQPSGVICEILKPDGTVSKGADLDRFAEEHGIKITSIEEIIRYRVSREVLVRQVARSRLETDVGFFDTFVFEDDVESKEHLALVYGDITGRKAPLIRLHSECLTGDVFGSQRCDCGPQLHEAMERIVADGCGVILYLRQEGRGIGLTNKLRAYELQDLGHDTVEANVALGFEPDQRDFAVAVNMLHILGVREARVMTNNPRKIETLKRLGINVSERLPIQIPATEYSRAYLETKRLKLGHLLD
jgi:3,4-dihydroxy 2-butanone 4-phosphate synthase/GTP cyclohydrolase II